MTACAEVAEGKFDTQFIVDAIQGGAGTSTNMNANEVIANRALEIMGFEKGDYAHCHPLNHVNMSQSTNDVYPTALKVALILELRNLIESMDYLRNSFSRKSAEFTNVIKMGRTQLQDAVPMTLGQEFATFARMTMEDEQRLREVLPLLCEINLGGTAIGTQLNAPAGYSKIACERLSALTGIPFVVAEDMVEATQDAGVFVMVSGVLKRVAAIKQGNPLDTDCMMGAQASQEQMSKIMSYLEVGKQEGAECLIGAVIDIIGTLFFLLPMVVLVLWLCACPFRSNS